MADAHFDHRHRSPRRRPALGDQGPRPPVRPRAVLFIFFTALMDVVALGLMIPVLPNLIKHFVGAG